MSRCSKASLIRRLTICAAWVFGGELRDVPYLVLNHDPTITGVVVLKNVLS